MSRECPVCYCVIGNENNYLRCGNDHMVCVECCGRIESCPLCRGSLLDFTNSHGTHVYNACRNADIGCTVAILTGVDHICRWDLLAQLNDNQSNILAHILVSLFIIRQPTLVWNNEALQDISNMYLHYTQYPEVWKRFFENDPHALSELLTIISINE